MNFKGAFLPRFRSIFSFIFNNSKKKKKNSKYNAYHLYQLEVKYIFKDLNMNLMIFLSLLVIFYNFRILVNVIHIKY